MIKAILATDEQGAIGLNNKLPWYCPEDLKYFQRCTTGQAVVFGRKTFDSINEILKTNKGLPNRKNIIISRKKHMSFMSVGSPLWVMSPERAIKFIETTTHYEDLWVVGGKSIYEQSFEFVNEIHHTVIKGTYEADTYMDMSFLENGEWRLYSKEILSDKATVSIWKRKEKLW